MPKGQDFRKLWKPGPWWRPPKSLESYLCVVGVACEEDLKSPSLLLRWQVIFPSLAMVPSMVWAQDSQQWCNQALCTVWGLAQGQEPFPKVVWMQTPCSGGVWCHGSSQMKPRCVGTWLGSVVTALILELGTIIIHLWILIASLQQYNKEKKSLTNVDIEHVNCGGNCKFDFDFFNRQHFTFMLPCRLSAASYIPFISVRMKIIH